MENIKAELKALMRIVKFMAGIICALSIAWAWLIFAWAFLGK